jgi:hypothetical protein
MKEIKKYLNNLDNRIGISYSDIEYLLYYTYNKRTLLSYFTCCLYKEKEILLFKYLRKRIRYQFFSKYNRKAKDIRLLTTDSGGFIIVFDLK